MTTRASRQGRSTRHAFRESGVARATRELPREGRRASVSPPPVSPFARPGSRLASTICTNGCVKRRFAIRRDDEINRESCTKLRLYPKRNTYVYRWHRLIWKITQRRITLRANSAPISISTKENVQ